MRSKGIKVMWSSSILIEEHTEPIKWFAPYYGQKCYSSDWNGMWLNVVWLKIIK